MGVAFVGYISKLMRNTPFGRPCASTARGGPSSGHVRISLSIDTVAQQQLYLIFLPDTPYFAGITRLRRRLLRFIKYIRNKRNNVSNISFTFKAKQMNMKSIDDLKRPSKEEQKAAMESYQALALTLEQIQSDYPEIEIEESKIRIQVPINALKLLAKILKETSQGKPISIVPIATEITTQAAAELLGCSRPHLVKLLEEGKISFTKIGKHRRIKYQDVLEYKKNVKAGQRKLLIEIMKADEESGLYDS